MGIAAFRPDGYLPEGIHLASEDEVAIRFGRENRQRRRLISRLRQWIELGKAIGMLRLLVDGSFVTATEEPDDVDAVMLIPQNFCELVEQGVQSAIELEHMFLTRQPEEIFAAEDEDGWRDWCEFFGRTREHDGRRKRLVETVQ